MRGCEGGLNINCKNVIRSLRVVLMTRSIISPSKISLGRGLLNPRTLLNLPRMFDYYEERTLFRVIIQLKSAHPALTDDHIFKILKRANPRARDNAILDAICATKKKYDPSLVTPEMRQELDEWDAFE